MSDDQHDQAAMDGSFDGAGAAGGEGGVRLAAVSFLNTAPLIEGVAKLPRVKLTLSAPSQLIGMLERDEADLALASVIDSQRSSCELAVAPCGIVGCDGATLTVRVFSKRPLEETEVLHADVDSHTSVALARVVLGELTGRRIAVEAFDADAWRARRAGSPDEPWPDTLLLIGDKVVTDSPPAAVYAHQLDLGAAWREMTGLPFVYAAWFCRAERRETDAVRLGVSLLDRQRRHNATRIGWIAERHAKQRGWPADTAREYLGELLRYDMTAAHEEAMRVFFERARDAGVIEGVREVGAVG